MKRWGLLTVLLAGALLVLGGGPAASELTGLGGDVVFTKPVKAVVFSHKSHVEDLGMSCNACHDKLFSMDSGSTEKLADFNHKAFDKGKYCGACHGKTASPMNAQCTNCHIGVKGHARLIKAGKTP
ncbi:MAG TPA: c(7)-type cytochrome triheme domain-containing protein [Dissulfurispiraceae bacterium]|nr:c(7)-type cytochrome triheme domain-containing protein [Dissulfurispiraceae bacterium]